MNTSNESSNNLTPKTATQQERSPVSEMQQSLNLVISLWASNLLDIVEGREVKHPIDDKTWDKVLKMVEIMPKLELFEAICNGEKPPEKAKPGRPKKEADPEEETETGEPAGNAFEERSKAIKAKLNGETVISTKTD